MIVVVVVGGSGVRVVDGVVVCVIVGWNVGDAVVVGGIVFVVWCV